MIHTRHTGRRVCQNVFGFLSCANRFLVAVPFLAFASASAHADSLGMMFDQQDMEASGLRTCAPSAAGATEVGEAFSAVADCAADRALGNMLDKAVGLAEVRGQAFLGKNFRIDNRLRLDVLRGGSGLSGDVDAVVPFSAVSFAAFGEEAERVLFLQTGVTRWMDSGGARRNDLRHGLVHRFAAFNGLEHGVFGLWAFAQQNLERGHERLVVGMDYAGRWGTGSLSYFLPTTGWRPGRPGHEERALEGMEFGLRLDVTDTISLNGAAGRWTETDGSIGWRTRSHLGLEWRLHPWLRLGGNWSDTESAGEAVSIRAAVLIPLGGGARDRPRWKGIGVAGGGAETSATELWRPVDSVGRIEVAQRAVRTANGYTSDNLTVQFLQNSADTGGTVRVEVSLSSPASTDSRIEVQLAPGSGSNPAVPGEDYIDEAVEITIPRGETSAVATFQLLDNPSLESARSLSVTTSVAT